MKFSDYLDALARCFGCRIVRLNQKGHSPMYDLRTILGPAAQPVIFDVGGNVGQSVAELKREFPDAIVHSFEPSPVSYEKLKKNVGGEKGVFAWNLALGSRAGRRVLHENELPTMSSLLDLGDKGWGAVKKETEVGITTLDQFCAEQKIDRIDILKSDTQGFDLEVFKGAETMMRANRIGLVYCEIIFSELYRDLPDFREVMAHLASRGYRLVTFYRVENMGDGFWSDALFINDLYFKDV